VDKPARAPTVIPGRRRTALMKITSNNHFIVSSSLDGEPRYWRIGGAGQARRKNWLQHSNQAEKR
jgi:hypothetical protein